MDAWLVGDEDGHPFVEQQLVKDGVNQYTNPFFLTGDPEWSDYAGDLDGDGVADMLIAQNVPHAHGDAFDAISCLTAVNFDGKVLWQSGRPDPRNRLLTNDTPFQIHDIDGDGRNEVVVVRDFKLEILDGSTGQVRR